jgi:2'-5' RNA ligase
MGDRVRAFVALPLPDAFEDRVVALMSDLQSAGPGLRLVRPGGVHLTLRFLGSATPGEISRLEPLLRSAADRCPRGEARVAGLGVFPERGAPRVLWLGVELPARFLALQRECEAAAVAAGFASEGRPFRPHLTLGRWQERARRPRLPEVDLGAHSLDELVLFRSRPQPGGSVYTKLLRCPLPSHEPGQAS